MRKLMPLLALSAITLSSCAFIDGLIPWKKVDFTGTMNNVSFSVSNNNETYKASVVDANGKLERELTVNTSNPYYAFNIGITNNTNGTIALVDRNGSSTDVTGGTDKLTLVVNGYEGALPSTSITLGSAADDPFVISFLLTNFTGTITITSI